MNSPILDIFVQKDGSTRCPLVARDSKEKKASPRPSAKKAEIECNSRFFNRSSTTVPSLISFTSHFRQLGFIAKQSRRKRNAVTEDVVQEDDMVIVDLLDVIQPEKRARRGPILGGNDNPLYESFIGTADLLLSFGREMQDHAKACEGTFYFRRSGIRNKGLALAFTCRCSLGSGCKYRGTFIASPGKFDWLSTATVEVTFPNGKIKKINTPDFKHALASASTPVKVSHGEQFLQTFGLKHRSRPYTSLIKRDVINLWMIEKERLTIEASLEEIR